MATTFAILGQGSSFWHGSETNNGGSADVRINDLFAYVAYQAAVQNLAPKDNSIIHELSLSPRSVTSASSFCSPTFDTTARVPFVTDVDENAAAMTLLRRCLESFKNIFPCLFRGKSAVEITSEFIDMYIEVPVEEWGTILDASDFPSLRLGMCGYFGTVLTLLYDAETVDSIVEYLLDQFTDIPEDLKVFCLQEFLPEMRIATQDVNLTSEEFLTFEGNTFSTLIKLLYAFLWQEEVLTTDDVWLQPETNELGTLMIPVVNAAANELNNFTYSDHQMQAGLHMYPGEAWCNMVIPHAKWHVETGIALTDFVFLTDEMYRLMN